jgi:hypothetical protein
MDRVREYTESRGYDFHELQTDLVARHKWNVREMNLLVAMANRKHQGGGSWNLLF